MLTADNCASQERLSFVPLIEDYVSKALKNEIPMLPNKSMIKWMPGVHFEMANLSWHRSIKYKKWTLYLLIIIIIIIMIEKWKKRDLQCWKSWLLKELNVQVNVSPLGLISNGEVHVAGVPGSCSRAHWDISPNTVKVNDSQCTTVLAAINLW